LRFGATLPWLNRQRAGSNEWGNVRPRLQGDIPATKCVFKIAGDGVLVEISSAVNAVLCAIDLQQWMAAANGEAPEDQRIGVNLGDVMVEGGDLYGDGVNITARLEGVSVRCMGDKLWREIVSLWQGFESATHRKLLYCESSR
jgi:class 3 adenylate cyclase